MEKKELKALREKTRNEYLEQISGMLFDADLDVLQTNSNTIAFPIVHGDGIEDFIRITIAIPTGDREGNAYDAYSESEEFKMKLAKQKTAK